MGTTFADYVATQDARNTIQLNIRKYTLMLCDALRQNYIEYSIKSHQHRVNTEVNADYHQTCIDDLKSGKCDYNFYPETGRKYHKIIMDADGSRSVHAFVDKKTGEVYKAASFKGPAKHVRFNLCIISDREWLLEHADWAGAYLYK
tara:strand:- start:383 stop:820 length:438 start_codon:yes stop_codon:yes gene_type:complete